MGAAKATTIASGTALLLWDDEDRCWTIGSWDGENWYNVASFIIAPIAWAPLPPPPVPA
jgi:hypothetical protein